MGSVMNWMGWVSLLICFAILGMGGAPIAEKFGPPWLLTVFTGISYVSLGFLSIATLLIGGLFLYHGALTFFGISPGEVIKKDEERLSKLPPVTAKVVEEKSVS